MNVVLVHPQIPANTGNIGRLCAVTGCKIHLIRPLGFFLDDQRRKRAGLDYWDDLSVTIHDCWDDFVSTADSRLVLVETGSSVRHSDIAYRADDFIVFGSETHGLPAGILDMVKAGWHKHVSLPMVRPRSLNLSSAAAIVVYEAWRQLQYCLW